MVNKSLELPHRGGKELYYSAPNKQSSSINALSKYKESPSGPKSQVCVYDTRTHPHSSNLIILSITGVHIH